MTTPLIAAAHGTRSAAGLATTRRLIDLVRAERPGLAVDLCFLDILEPSLGERLDGLTGPAVVVPVLLSTGYHVGDDIPSIVAQHPQVRVARHLGPDRVLSNVLRDRLISAGADRADNVVLVASPSRRPDAAEDVAAAAADLAEVLARPVLVQALDDSLPAAIAGLPGTVAIASYLLAEGAFHDALLGLEPIYHRAVSEELERQGRRVSLRFRLLHHVVMPPLIRFSCRHSDAVFCLNEGEARFLTTGAWATRERVQVVANGIPEAEILPPRDYRSAERLVCVAQWLPVKGVRYLVAAFTDLARRHPELRLTCAGTGASADAVLAGFPEDVRSRVTVLPRLDREGILDQLRQSDIFVFPTLFEGFSLALVEALAAGLPVVCTPVGSAPDILRGDVDAITIPVADAESLVHAVERLIGDETLRRRLGQAGRAVAARFTWPEIGADYEHRIQQVVNRHASR